MIENDHLAPGTMLHGGTYRVVRFLSQGGFGCTYEAEHTVMGERMALKEFFVGDFCNRSADGTVTLGTESRRGLVDKLRRKFLQEARSVYRLRHANIVRVTDVFEENGTAYFAMDYIDGPSLSDLVRDRGPLPEAEALGYISQVCDALEYVHGENMLHLDIKPANIMVNSKGQAILIDFGVAKQYDEEGGRNTSTLLGRSPGYAPLEQNAASVRTFTPPTDIYALGATLYTLLSGKTPPDSSDLASGGRLDPLPSAVSAATSSAIAAAMRSQIAERPQSVSEFRALLDGNKPAAEPATDRTPTTPTTPNTPKTPTTPTTPERVGQATQLAGSPDSTGGSIASLGVDVPSGDGRGWKAYAAIAAVLVAVGIVLGIIFGGNKDDASDQQPQTMTAFTDTELEDFEEPDYSVEALQEEAPLTGTPVGHEWVDLGLPSGLKWATCNVGATTPTDEGYFYAWGETRTKSEYTESNCQTYGKSIGSIAGKSQYDAARANWGGNWRLPTEDEFEELIANCDYSWETRGGINGALFTSKENGKSIFLPASGYWGTGHYYGGSDCGYWSATPNGEYDAYYLGCGSGGCHVYGYDYRYWGRSVRAVLE